MKRTRLLLLGLATLPAVLLRAEDAPPSVPTLYWSDGEKLTGDIVSATPEAVTWQSPAFLDPLALNWSAVDYLDGSSNSHPSDEPFAFSMRDGSFIYGDISSITGELIGIHSAANGDARLKRSEILAIRRVKGQAAIYQGPTGDIGWSPVMTQPGGSIVPVNNGMFNQQTLPSPLTAGPGGALVMRTWNRGGRLSVDVPPKADVQLNIRSTQRPEFMLAFAGDPANTLRLETWNDNLVLAADEKFHFVRKIQSTEREITLRVDWNRETQECFVYGAKGEQLAEWKVPLPPLQAGTAAAPPPPSQIAQRLRNLRLRLNGQIFVGNFRRVISDTRQGGASSGLLLQNRGLDLTLTSLQINPWSGKPAPRTGAGEPVLELADGRVIAGGLLSGNGTTIRQQTAQGAVTTKTEDMIALIFSPALPQPSKAPATFFGSDGSIVRGTLASMANGRATLTTSFSEGPYTTSLKQLRRFVPHQGSPQSNQSSLDGMDKITIQGTTLHGSTEVGADGALRWKPVGGTSGARLSSSVGSEIRRVTSAVAPTPAGALFYLTSGDIIPGKLGSVDREGAEITSPLMSARKLGPGQLRAVQFIPGTSRDVQGFTDPGWTVVSGVAGDMHREAGRVEIPMGVVFGHPTLMQSSEIRFKYASVQGLSGLRLRMFCDGVKPDHSMNLLMLNTGNQFMAGMESPTNVGQFDNQNQMIIKQGEPVSIRLKIDEAVIQLYVNDSLLQEIPFTSADVAGTGLIFEANNVWHNNGLVAALTDFSAKTAPGSTWLPSVSSDIRNQVITIPRYQKDDPPRHALLSANGDVLRGELEAATDTTFRFRTGLEHLDIPRDRVNAMIWLKPPDPNAQPAPPAIDDKDDPLQQRIQMRISFGATQVNQYLSFIQSQIPGFKYKLPSPDDDRVAQVVIGGGTLGDTLTSLCAHFDLQYTVDKDGTFDFQPADAPLRPDLVQKSYWLKPYTFPAMADVEAILKAKGLTFGESCSVAWQADAGLLTLASTSDNQAKLAALIESTWGGSLGSPTHWLQLTDGGRLALAVDSFAHDTVTGHSPAYGSIQVPLADVMIIRTSPPKESNAMKSLQGWQLVNAPEPVIPDSAGGGSSPMLGKDAPDIDLPTLDGGKFTLADQKGQIVVVDFWASWCAPCVQSLPALIASVGTLPGDRVKLIGVNQGEAAEQVKRFLAARDMKLDVALDASQEVGHKYGVDAIPHTVIVGPDGKIAWEATGYDPDGESAVVDTIKRLLKPGSTAPPAAAVVH